MSVYDKFAFRERVQHAARCILSGNTNSRAFDTCFEMYDGDAVVVALMRKRERSPDFKAAQDREWGQRGLSPTWCETARKYADFRDRDLPRLSRMLIQGFRMDTRA